MFRRIIRHLKYPTLLGLIILLSIFFIPRTYQVLPFQERSETKYWELDNGSSIGYTFLEAEGSGNLPPIIYLHGGPGGMISNTVIKSFRLLAKAGYNIYLYDQVGSGHSNRLSEISDYSVQRHREDLEKIVELLGVDKVILFGQSWGAMLAIEYLSLHPDKVEKLVLSGPGPILPINRALANLPVPDSLDLIRPKFSNKEGNEKANNWRTKLMFRWANIFESKLASDKEADEFFTFLNGELSRSTTCDGSRHGPPKGGGGYYAHVMTVKSFNGVINKRDKLRDLKTPVLILRGQCDNQKWGYTAEYLSIFQNVRLEIIPSAGHSIDIDRIQEYIQPILQFLDGGK